MKVVKVEYTTKADYADTNKANINAVMEELRGLGDCGVKYFVSTKEDGRSFVHIVVFRDEEVEGVISNLDSFKKFQEGLSQGKETDPVTENLELVNSSFNFFS